MQSKQLHSVALFSQLKKHDLEALARVTDEIDVSEGRVLMKQGDIGREFFVIESGTAAVTRDGEHVADIGPGDFFGEIALIEETQRTATVTATSSMEVIVLTASAFRSLRHSMPGVYETVKAAIAQRH